MAWLDTEGPLCNNPDDGIAYPHDVLYADEPEYVEIMETYDYESDGYESMLQVLMDAPMAERSARHTTLQPRVALGSWAGFSCTTVLSSLLPVFNTYEQAPDRGLGQ